MKLINWFKQLWQKKNNEAEATEVIHFKLPSGRRFSITAVNPKKLKK